MSNLLLAVTSLSVTVLAIAASSLLPSLNNGIICVAEKKDGDYFYDSASDSDAIARKQPISMTILYKQEQVTDNNAVIIDKTNQSATLVSLEKQTSSSPEAQIAGAAATTLTGDRTFKGKTETGVPIMFNLSKDYANIRLTYDGKHYTGVCH
jgi:hypothetical protein